LNIRRGRQARNRNPHFHISNRFFEGVWTNVDRKCAMLFFASAGTPADIERIKEALHRFVKEEGIHGESWGHEDADDMQREPDDGTDFVRDLNANVDRIKEKVTHFDPSHPNIGAVSWSAIQSAIGRLRDNPWLLEMYQDQRENSDLYWRQQYTSRGWNPGENEVWGWNLAGQFRDLLGLGSRGVPN
jgi:hypothetical protein